MTYMGMVCLFLFVAFESNVNQECTLTFTDGFGSWSSDNCRVVYESGDKTRCECSQAAHFGLLFVCTHLIADIVTVTSMHV